jgi:hypothetical protein
MKSKSAYIVLLYLFVLSLIFAGYQITRPAKSTATVPKETSSFSAKELAVISPFKLPTSIQQPFKTTNLNWGDTVSPRIRFILVPHYQQLNDHQIKQIHLWLDEKRTVLFIENNVEPKLLAAKLKFEFKLTELQSTQPFSYRLYGFGYSFVYGKYMPVFYGATDSFSDQSIADALSFLSKLIDKPEY